MEKIRIGILGCANIVERLMGDTINKSDDFELFAIASRNKEKALRFSSNFSCLPVVGYDQLLDLDEIDAIYIPLPIAYHEEWAIKALEKGKHVLCEKSLSTDYDSVKRIVDTAKSKNKILFENFMFEYHSQIEWLKNKIFNNGIGEIRNIRCSFGFPIFNSQNNIRYKKELGGGALLDAGAYTIKATTIILGRACKVIGASLTNDSVYDVDFFGGAFIVNKKGQFSQVSFGFDNYYQCFIEIWGSKGKLLLDRAFTAGPGYKPRGIIEYQDEIHEFSLPADDHFSNILNAFAQSIRSGENEKQLKEILIQAKLIQEVKNATK